MPKNFKIAAQIVVVSFVISYSLAVSAQTEATTTTVVSASEPSVEESIGTLVLSGAKGVGSVAKQAGTILGRTAKFAYKQIQQKELAEQFYVTFDRNAQELRVLPLYYNLLKDKVSSIYIEEDRDRKLDLDLITFHDMKNVMKREYALLLLQDARNGEFKTYFINGRTETLRYYQNGQLNGKMKTYYKNASVKYLDYYKDGELVKRQKFDMEGKLEFSQTYGEEAEVLEVSKEIPSQTQAKPKEEMITPVVVAVADQISTSPQTGE